MPIEYKVALDWERASLEWADVQEKYERERRTGQPRESRRDRSERRPQPIVEEDWDTEIKKTGREGILCRAGKAEYVPEDKDVFVLKELAAKQKQTTQRQVQGFRERAGQTSQGKPKSISLGKLTAISPIRGPSPSPVESAQQQPEKMEVDVPQPSSTTKEQIPSVTSEEPRRSEPLQSTFAAQVADTLLDLPEPAQSGTSQQRVLFVDPQIGKEPIVISGATDSGTSIVVEDDPECAITGLELPAQPTPALPEPVASGSSKKKKKRSRRRGTRQRSTDEETPPVRRSSRIRKGRKRSASSGPADQPSEEQTAQDTDRAPEAPSEEPTRPRRKRKRKRTRTQDKEAAPVPGDDEYVSFARQDEHHASSCRTSRLPLEGPSNGP